MQAGAIRFSSAADGYDVKEGRPGFQFRQGFRRKHDGMEAFFVDGHQLIAVNHEYVNPEINLPAAQAGAPANADDVLKLQNLHGVTVMEIAEGAGASLLSRTARIIAASRQTPE